MCWYSQNTGKGTDDPHDLDTRLKLSPQCSALYCHNQHLARHTAEKNNLQVFVSFHWDTTLYCIQKGPENKIDVLEVLNFWVYWAKTDIDYHKVLWSNTKTGTCLRTHFLLGVSVLNRESNSMWLAWPDMPLKLEGVLTFAPGLQT